MTNTSQNIDKHLIPKGIKNKITDSTLSSLLIPKESTNKIKTYLRFENQLIKKDFIKISSFSEAEELFSQGNQLLIDHSLPESDIYIIVERLQLGQTLTPEQRQHVLSAKEFYNSHAQMFDGRAAQTANAYTELAALRTILHFYYGPRAKTPFIQILDAGCGNGRLMIPLLEEKFNIYGVDISDTLIAAAKNRAPQYQHLFQVGNLLEIPHNNNTFDAVIMMWHVISELSHSLDLAFKEIYRILKPNGLFIFDLPNKTSDNIRQQYQGKPGKEDFQVFLAKIPAMDVLQQALLRHGITIELMKPVTMGVDKFMIICRKK